MQNLITNSAIVFLLVFSMLACNKTNSTTSLQDLKILNADTTFSYFGKNGNDIQLQNSYFRTHQFEHNGSMHTYVFKMQQTEQILANQSIKELEVSPVYSNQNTLDWKVKLAPDEINFKKDVLIAEMFGNNDYEPSYKIVNINSGNTLIEYTYGNLEIQFPDAISKRYFGVYAQKGRQNSNFSFNQKDQIAYFTYASNLNTLQTIEVKAANENIFKQIDKNSPMLEFDALENNAILSTTARSVYYSGLSNPETEKELINIGIKVTFYVGEDFTAQSIFIPIVADKIDPSGIIYNKNVFQLKIQ